MSILKNRYCFVSSKFCLKNIFIGKLKKKKDYAKETSSFQCNTEREATGGALKKVFSKIIALKVARWNLQAKSLKNTFDGAIFSVNFQGD